VEQGRQALAKEKALPTETHERLVLLSAEQDHEIERLIRGFVFKRVPDRTGRAQDLDPGRPDEKHV
jgi:hypothetical protein